MCASRAAALCQLILQNAEVIWRFPHAVHPNSTICQRQLHLVHYEFDDDTLVAALLEHRFGHEFPRVLIKGEPSEDAEEAFETLLEETTRQMSDTMADIENYQRKLEAARREAAMRIPESHIPRSVYQDATRPLDIATSRFPFVPMKPVRMGDMPARQRPNQASFVSQEPTCLKASMSQQREQNVKDVDHIIRPRHPAPPSFSSSSSKSPTNNAGVRSERLRTEELSVGTPEKIPSPTQRELKSAVADLVNDTKKPQPAAIPVSDRSAEEAKKHTPPAPPPSYNSQYVASRSSPHRPETTNVKTEGYQTSNQPSRSCARHQKVPIHPLWRSEDASDYDTLAQCTILKPRPMMNRCDSVADAGSTRKLGCALGNAASQIARDDSNQVTFDNLGECKENFPGFGPWLESPKCMDDLFVDDLREVESPANDSRAHSKRSSWTTVGSAATHVDWI